MQNTLPLPTRFLTIDFDPEHDLEEYVEQTRSVTEHNLDKVWLPILRADEAKDEGLGFPPRSRILAQILWHELEKENVPKDASQAYLDEILKDADDTAKKFNNISRPGPFQVSSCPIVTYEFLLTKAV
jgi:hypothetical protein